MPHVPNVPVLYVGAGFRAANPRLREPLAERDARIEEFLARLAAVGDEVAGLQAQVADLAAKATSTRGSPLRRLMWVDHGVSA